MTDVNVSVNTGVGGDTVVSSGAPDANYGGWALMLTDANAIQKILIRFDLSSIPAGSVCTAASIKLTPKDNDSAHDLSVYKITDANGDWVEGNKIIQTGSGMSCWNYKKYNTDAWAGSAGLATAGTDYINTVIASFSGATTANTQIEIPFNADGLLILESWFGDATNNGFLLTDTSGSDIFYHTGEATTESYRPVLSITYTELIPDELTAADFTLAPVTFEAPVLSVTAPFVNLAAKDLTLAPVMFDAPVLSTIIITPPERIYTVDAEIREYAIPAEGRKFYIDPDMRGVKIDIDRVTKFMNEISYNGLAGKDLILARPTFDTPYLIPGALVQEPDADFLFAPFYVIDNGDRTFGLFSKSDPAAPFDLRTYADITVNKSYYVDKATGNDSNSGADWDNALATFKAAFAKSDVDRIYVKDGYYYHSEVFSGNSYQTFTRSVEIIGVTNNVTFSGDLRNELSAWTKVDNHYESNTGGLTLPIWALDNANLTIYGFPGGLTKKTTVAEVDATPNSWCVIFQSGVGWWVYLRTFDDRAPDNNIILLCDNSFTMVLDTVPGINVYIKNISFYGRCITKNSTASGNLYMEDCSFYGGITVDTGHEVILSRCSGTSYIEDAAAYASDTHDLHAIEIDCDFGPGRGGGSCQASTTHMGTRIIRVRGDYHGMPDHAIGDVHPEYGGKTWIIGSHIYDSGVGVWHMVQWCWLDTCMIENCTRGIQNNTDTTTYTHELVNACQNAIAGSLITYDR